MSQSAICAIAIRGAYEIPTDNAIDVTSDDRGASRTVKDKADA